MSIVSLHALSLKLAGYSILDKVDWQIQSQDKIALVGRNGAGKSTLLKLLEGEILPDSGIIHRINGLKIAGLAQNVPSSETETVYHFLVKGLGRIGEVIAAFRIASNSGELDNLSSLQEQIDNAHAWDLLPQIEIMATKLGLEPDNLMSQLSGGMKRRVLLAAALIARPDLLLLDEPTNHLDLAAIEWLESFLKNYSGSLVLVTHDRQFLAQIANRIVQIDRGCLYLHDCSYEDYLDRREAMSLTEQKHNELFDKRLSKEELWIRTGVKARRTRNEGRVRALEAMRAEHAERRLQVAKVRSVALGVTRSGQIVLEAEHLGYSLNDKVLIDDFSLLLTRGAKVGIIGANGCGKTSLVRLLLGELEADSGTISRGSSLAIAYFDQLRSQLDDNKTLMANVADGADFVIINGKQQHVSSYLREFLFEQERFNQLVSCLSGGERNRLLIAKLLAKPVNLLVMDEPTNDLDIETLELLESMLINYQGTLLLISHDRVFINNVVTSVLVYEGDGCFNEYVGTYEDYIRVKKQLRVVNSTNYVKPRAKSSNIVLKLSFSEQRELTELPQRIEKLEQEITILQQKINVSSTQSELDLRSLVETKKNLLQHELDLVGLYARWEILESRQ